MPYSNGKRSGVDNRCSNEQIENIVTTACFQCHLRPVSSICKNASAASSGMARRVTGCCRSESRRSIEPCRMAGWPWAQFMKSSAPEPTRRTAPLPRGLSPASPDASGMGSSCGVSRSATFTGRGWPSTGSTLRGSRSSAPRAMTIYCGRSRKDCACPTPLGASPRSSARSAGCRWLPAAGCSLPPSAPAFPRFCCGAGAPARRLRPSAPGQARR